MKTIGLICEGVSEINVMMRIVSKYLGDEAFVHAVEPDTTLKSGHLVQTGYGGWAQVLRHCNDEKIEAIMQYNDYVIIQIDTDACQEKEYNVMPNNEQGQKKADDVFYHDIQSRMVKNISSQVLKKYAGRILFAICDNEIECWLLPLYYSDNNRCKSQNCIRILNRALGKKDIGGIPDKAKNDTQARAVYDKILKNFKNKKTIQDCAQYHYGFTELIKQLDSVVL